MVNDKLLKEIEDYCKLNELEVEKTLNDALRQGFTIVQYGLAPNTTFGKEKPVEVVKEVIKEVIKEVPVEKIVEVERIIEKPVERIVEVIKEVPIDKIVEVEKSININVDGHKVNYMDYIEELNNKISNLELDKKKQEINLDNSSKKINEITKTNTDLQSKVESLKKELKECKDSGGYDLYGEK